MLIAAISADEIIERFTEIQKFGLAVDTRINTVIKAVNKCNEFNVAEQAKLTDALGARIAVGAEVTKDHDQMLLLLEKRLCALEAPPAVAAAAAAPPPPMVDDGEAAAKALGIAILRYARSLIPK